MFMDSLEKIKKEYLEDYFINYPTKEERDFYSINEKILRKWRTEDILQKKDHLYKLIDDFKSNYKKFSLKELKAKIYDIDYHFHICVENEPFEDEYYLNIIEIMKKMYENDMFDFLTYERIYSFASITNPLPPDLIGTPARWDIGKKYTGIIVQLFYTYQNDVYDEVIKYFANVIYQKYGLYLQDDMEMLIRFLDENRLGYGGLLETAHKRAMELDYPSHHKFKYQLEEKKKIEWRELNLSEKKTISKYPSIEEIKERYLREPWYYHPKKEVMKYYSIDVNVLNGWMTEYLLEKKEQLYIRMNQFNSLYNKVKMDDSRIEMHYIQNLFYICTENYPATKEYYYELPKILEDYFENDMFDFNVFEKYSVISFARVTSFLKQENNEATKQQEKLKKYSGNLVFVYYNNQEVFHTLLLYFANVIYQKYGLYLQNDMKSLIKFCIEFNLPYVDLLKEAHKKAMELDYPSNHDFKYQFGERLKVEWKVIE